MATIQELASFQTPANVYHQDYTASVANSKRLAWSIECPPNMLLDAEVLVTYQVQLNSDSTIGRMFGGGSTTVSNPAPGHGFVALRQGMVMHHGMIRSDLLLNEERIVQPLREYTNVAMRFYATEDEIQNLCSMSGGDLDSGGFTPHTIDGSQMFSPIIPTNGTTDASSQVSLAFEPVDAIVSTADIHTQVQPRFARIDAFENPGLTSRWYRMGKLSREQQGTQIDNDKASFNYFTLGNTQPIELTERLPFAPFKTWETRDRVLRMVHNLRKIEIDIEMSPDAFSYIQGENGTGGGTHNFVFDWFSIKPVMHCKWIVPSSKVERMPRMKQPFIYYEDYSKVFTYDYVATDQLSFGPELEVVLDARLHSTPSKMFIYASSTVAGLDETSEHHLELLSVDLAVDGVPGKLRRLSTPQMFALYLRNSPSSSTRRFKYDEWRQRYCALVLNREDIGWDIENKDGRIMRLTARVRSWWAFPSFQKHPGIPSQDQDREFRLHIMAERRYEMWMDKRRNELVRA